MNSKARLAAGLSSLACAAGLLLWGLATQSCTSSNTNGSPDGGSIDSSAPDGQASNCRRDAGARAGCATPSVAPVGWWPLDGNAWDIARCDDGTVVGTGGGYVPAMVGEGFSSMGQSSYILVPDAPQLDTVHFTVMAWAKVDALSGLNKWILGKGPSSGTNADFTYSLGVGGTACCSIDPQAFVTGPAEAGHLYMDFGDGANEQIVFATDLFPLGSFVHVAATADGSNILLYVNGQVAATTQQKLTPKSSVDALMIGGANAVPGIVDEIMVWNTALSGADIAAIFAAGASGVCPQ